MNCSMCFVAGPMAMTSTPLASGSSVPAWPVFAPPAFRLTNSTTSIEVGPSGLSMTSMPERSGPNVRLVVEGIGGMFGRSTSIVLRPDRVCVIHYLLSRTGVRVAEGAALEMLCAGFPAPWVRIPPCPLRTRVELFWSFDLKSGCSAAWLARLTGGQEVGGSNPPTPTEHPPRISWRVFLLRARLPRRQVGGFGSASPTQFLSVCMPSHLRQESCGQWMAHARGASGSVADNQRQNCVLSPPLIKAESTPADIQAAKRMVRHGQADDVLCS